MHISSTIINSFAAIGFIGVYCGVVGFLAARLFRFSGSPTQNPVDQKL